jgi:hypothetical protein
VRVIRTLREATVDAINAVLRANLAPVERVTVMSEVLSAANADDPFAVPHTLGTRPDRYIALPLAKAYVYHTPADEAAWDERFIVLRCSAASTRIRVSVGTLA